VLVVLLPVILMVLETVLEIMVNIRVHRLPLHFELVRILDVAVVVDMLDVVASETVRILLALIVASGVDAVRLLVSVVPIVLILAFAVNRSRSAASPLRVRARLKLLTIAAPVRRVARVAIVAVAISVVGATVAVVSIDRDVFVHEIITGIRPIIASFIVMLQRPVVGTSTRAVVIIVVVSDGSVPPLLLMAVRVSRVMHIGRVVHLVDVSVGEVRSVVVVHHQFAVLVVIQLVVVVNVLLLSVRYHVLFWIDVLPEEM
jgi:hypothetical protein